MNSSMQSLMLEATRLTRSGQVDAATRLLRQALAGSALAGMAGSGFAAGDVHAGSVARSASTIADPPASFGTTILDGYIAEVPDGASRPMSQPAAVPEDPAIPAGDDAFIAGTWRHGALSRRYKLYIPPAAGQGRVALVVMLHGCTQSADDFAAGTAMNTLARRDGFFVLYPEQGREANPSSCWNWFKHNHQRRDSGEPALIASLTRAVIARHGLDDRRVHVAGLSAGGAMAAIVAAAYPDLFASAGVHSGLSVGSAGNVAQALAVMKDGRGAAAPGQGTSGRGAPSPVGSTGRSVPTIVFHGDQDRTVHPANGERVVADVVSGLAVTPGSEAGQVAGGRRYTRTLHADATGRVVAEHWRVQGAGHAWSGGRTSGSYTDPAGPDASVEMLRFFREHPRAAGSGR